MTLFLTKRIISLQDRKEKKLQAKAQAKSLNDKTLAMSGYNEALRKYIDDQDLNKAVEDILYESAVLKDKKDES